MALQLPSELSSSREELLSDNGSRYLAAETKFSKIEVFEQRANPGGLWNYTALNVVDQDFSVPRTRPTKYGDTAIWTDECPEAQFVSPVYDFLETNIPNTLMNYCDFPFPEGSSLFPKHAVVKKYLHDYAEEIKDLLTLETQVVSVRKVGRDAGAEWELELLDLKTKASRTEHFDAVLVASGHYNDPFIPNIEGLASFNEKHPGVVTHSKFYRRPDQYAGKVSPIPTHVLLTEIAGLHRLLTRGMQKVVVVGNSASGIDVSAQVAAVSQKPILVSEKTPTATSTEERDWASMKPEIDQFIPETRSVQFADGSAEGNIDAVIFCTGYFYSFPFLKSLEPPVITDGAYARNLYQHILYIDDPTLAFLGVPQRVVPLPISEAQSAWVARIWSDRLRTPDFAEMRDWEASTLKEKGGSKFIHNLAFPKDVAYINFLHDSSLAAKKKAGLDNDGQGKLPPYWGEEKAWVRERFPLIKIASRALGEKRHQVKTLEQLGFDFKAWKEGRTAEGQLS